MSIRRGTAARLGLHQQTFMKIAEFGPTPHGQLRAVVSLRGSRMMTVDSRGRYIEDAGVEVSPGMVRDTRAPFDPWKRVAATRPF